MAILPSIDSPLPDPVDPSPGFDTTTNTYDANVTSYSNGDNKALIAIEVIFSLLVLVIVMFCFSAGLKRRRRLREERTERMVENAITTTACRPQVVFTTIVQTHSSGTVTTLLQVPPPSYSPPDPTTQLSGEAISRLDRLLVNQICTPPNGVTLPKYTDLYRPNS